MGRILFLYGDYIRSCNKDGGGGQGFRLQEQNISLDILALTCLAVPSTEGLGDGVGGGDHVGLFRRNYSLGFSS